MVRTFANKNDGIEQSVRAMEHRQESTDKAIKNLDKKYEGMMNIMAQIMSKLNDKGKEVEESSSGNGQMVEGVKGKNERNEGRGERNCPGWTSLCFMGPILGSGLGELTSISRYME